MRLPRRPAKQLVCLRPNTIPTMRDVERHRRQLLALTVCLLVSLACLVGVAAVSHVSLPPGLPPEVVRLGLLVFVAIFSFYAMAKEARLTGLTRLIIDEHELTVALASRVRDLDSLLKATRTMNLVLDMRQVLDAILRSSLELLGARSGSIMLVRGKDELTTLATAGESAARGARLRFGVGVAGRVAATRQPLLIRGTLSEVDRGVAYTPGQLTPASAMSVPLIQNDELLGVLNVNAEPGRAFSEYELRALGTFAGAAAGAIANAQLYEEQRLLTSRAMHQALHDPLTGLPNRALLLDRIQHALLRSNRGERQVALLFLDVDDFKRINDGLGHVGGDAVLRAVARRLVGCLRASDTVARFGGDEFAAVLDGVSGPDEATATARRMLAALDAPVDVSGREIRFFASIGVAMAGSTATPGSLLREADAAMHAAKQSGKNRVVVFDPAMTARATRMLELEEGVYAALERGELTLHYQPICDLADESRVAFEALLRWNHDRHGLLAACDFMPAVQQAGLLPRIDAWALRRACQDARRELPGFLVHVNVAAETLHALDLAREVEAACSESGLAPDRLVLELTETSLISAPERAAQQFAHLKTLGVRLVLDDFGTGYSTFSYLQRFPVDGVKVDRAFVADVGLSFEKSRLVDSIVRFAENLGIEVVAEGVEQPAQQQALLEMGCRLGQGHLLGTPVPAGSCFGFPAFLHSRPEARGAVVASLAG